MIVEVMNALAVAIGKGSNKQGEGARGGREKQEVRDERIAEFWIDPINAILVPVGPILKNGQAGKTYAQFLHEGEWIDLVTVKSTDGVILPLRDGYRIYVPDTNVIGGFGCPFCFSGHGTGFHPASKSASGLSTNQFYYRPADKNCFIISDNCFTKYVEQLGHKGKVMSAKQAALALYQAEQAAMEQAAMEQAIAEQADALASIGQAEQAEQASGRRNKR